jgi:hypothetical protein
MTATASRFDALKARWERLTERERVAVASLGMVMLAMVMAIVGFLVGTSLNDLEEDNAGMRAAIKDLDTNRDTYQKLRNKSSSLEVRLGHGPVQLEGILEAAANQSDVTISETVERQPVPVGNKKFIERAVDVRLQKVTLDQLAKFMRKIETGANLVVVTQLNVRTRDDKHEDLQVEMTVSTWEKAQETKPGRKKEGGGPSTGKEGKAI